MKKTQLSLLSFALCGLVLIAWVAFSVSTKTRPVEPARQAPAGAPEQTSSAQVSPGQSPSSAETELETAASSPESAPPVMKLLSDSAVQQLESQSTLSSVCGSLSKINRKQNEPIEPDELSERFEDSVFGRSFDPVLESVKPIVKFALKKRALRGFLGQPDDMNDTVAPDQRAFNRYQALAASREEIEQILDQSYLLMMMGRSVELNPGLASDPHLISYCDSIESELNHLTATNFTEQKKLFREFLRSAQIQPDSIGFDPEYKTDLKLELLDGAGTSFNVGWLRELYASRE
jgi:hypothetical protein